MMNYGNGQQNQGPQGQQGQVQYGTQPYGAQQQQQPGQMAMGQNFGHAHQQMAYVPPHAQQVQIYDVRRQRHHDIDVAKSEFEEKKRTLIEIGSLLFAGALRGDTVIPAPTLVLALQELLKVWDVESPLFKMTWEAYEVQCARAQMTQMTQMTNFASQPLRGLYQSGVELALSLYDKGLSEGKDSHAKSYVHFLDGVLVKMIQFLEPVMMQQISATNSSVTDSVRVTGANSFPSNLERFCELRRKSQCHGSLGKLMLAEREKRGHWH